MRSLEKIPTGKEAEWHCLGYGKNWEQILKEKNISPETLKTFWDWVEFFKLNYPKEEAINPSPKSRWSTDLFDMVMKHLELDPESLEDQGLYFYNALNSGLDQKGVDALFVFQDQKTNREKIFTIDLTLKSGKDVWKADLVINKIPFKAFRFDNLL